MKVPGVKGEFQVLKNHAPIVSALEEGKVTIETGEGGYTYYDAAAGEERKARQTPPAISSSSKSNAGFIEVLNNEISLLVQGVSQL